MPSETLLAEQSPESSFHVKGLAIRPFFEACNVKENISGLERVLASNSGKLAELNDAFHIFRSTNKVRVISTAQAISSFYQILTSPDFQIPADTAFRITKELTDIAVGDAQGKERERKITAIGEEAVKQTANRNVVLSTILSASIKSYIDLANLFGSIPKHDKIAQLLFMCKNIESRFTDFILIDTFFKRPGCVEVSYAYMPGSEHLANRINMLFNIGTLGQVPRLIKKDASVRVSLIDQGKKTEDLFGESITLDTRHSLEELLGKEKYRVEGSALTINGERCASIDERRIVEFTRDISVNGLKFLKRERFHLNEGMKLYTLEVNYPLPSGISRKYFVLPAIGAGAVGGVMGAVIGSGDIRIAAGTAVLTSLAAFAGGIVQYLTSEKMSSQMIADTLEQIADAQREERQNYLTIYSSIETLKDAAQVLSKQQTMLQHAQLFGNAAVLSAAVAHDSGNILTAVSYKLRMGQFSDVSNLCDRLFELNESHRRILSGESEEREQIYLPDFLQGEVSVLSNLKAYKQILLQIDSESQSKLKVRSAPISLKQIIQNLVINAFDAESDNVDIRVGYRKLGREEILALDQMNGILNAGEGEYALIEVKDHGKGIPVNVRGRIFDFGFSTKEGSDSFRGVGMSSVAARIEQEGGFLRFQSRHNEESPEHGTEFYVYLPLEQK